MPRKHLPLCRGLGAGLLCLFLFAVAANAQGIQTFEGENLRVTMEAWVAQGAIGYLPIELEIENRGADRAIEIATESQTYGGSYGGAYYDPTPGTLNLRQTIRLKARDRVHMTVPLPAGAGNQNTQFKILERGRLLRVFSFNFLGARAPTTLIVADPSSSFGSMAKDLPRKPVGTPSSGPFPGMQAVDLLREPERLPVNWLGYTTLQSVFIGTQEWSKLAEAQQDALLAWTAAGGDLFLADGDGKTLFPDSSKRPAALGSGAAAARYFLGQIFFTTTVELAEQKLDGLLLRRSSGPNTPWSVAPQERAISDPAVTKLKETLGRGVDGPKGTGPWQLPVRLFGEMDDEAIMRRGYRPEIPGLTQGFRLPIPGVSGVPARAYLGILVLFTILIGPANYFILKRKRQQVLMVLTTPLISAAFITVLAGYALAGEGFGLRGRAVTLTYLDQGSKQAATRAVISMYAAGMAPWGGMRFARDTAIFPIANRASSINMDLTESQQFGSGLVQARTPANFEQVAVRTARERLTFARDGERLTVVNGLGGSLTALYYRDGGRVYGLAGPLAAGGKGDLRSSAGPDAPPIRHPEGHFIEFNHFFLNSAADGAFFAVMDRSPFWEPGAANIEERGSLHMVTGYAAAEP